jgi:hypothetical protein
VCVRNGYQCVQSICDTRDCFTRLNGDDPSSKFAQAKEALYEVLKQVDDVNFGFATYNQDELRLRAKHWLYRATDAGVSIPNYGAYPPIGAEEVFGYEWACNGGSAVGCASNSPADLADAWDRTRVQRLPKGGIFFNQNRQFYVSSAGTTYRVTYTPNTADTLGDAVIRVSVRIEDRDRYGNWDTIGTQEVHFAVISDFNSWGFNAARNPPQNGYFNQGDASDSPVNNGTTCNGWDPNTDTGNDDYNGYDIRFPTTQATNPAFRPYLNEGDVIPLSWLDDNKEKILERLAPNLALGETDPDVRTARYFEDVPRGGDNFLHLKDASARPIVAFGSTPLGNSLSDFRTWYQGWSNLAAQGNDPDWACRKKYLLVLTDGDDTCGGSDPCDVAGALHTEEAVDTYVVGFGVDNAPGNKLNCMADRGGTGAPIYPQNKDELVEALTSIFGDIKEEARSFASAAVPSVQAEVEDKIYLSSFTPLNNEPVWDGHLDAYLKPLPLTNDGKPDKSIDCASLPANQQGGCFLWDAGVVLLGQAPTAAEVATGDLKLGVGDNQRRVFFPRAKDLLTEAMPNKRALFRTPDHDTFSDPFSDPVTTDKAWQDLFDGLGLSYTAPDDIVNPVTAPKLAADGVVEKTLAIKNAVIDNPDGTTTPITYLLGDIFHSNPVVVDRPNDFRAFAGNFYTDGSDSGGTCEDTNPGYRCFAQKQQRRRKMLAVGSDDGSFHFFDAGIYNPTTGKFSNGTGEELFAFIPRLVLPVVRKLATATSQIYALDGSGRVVDVFIDPVHSLTGSPPGPSTTDRQWRTVLVAGLREGGLKNGGVRSVVTLDNNKPFTSGYFALDLTQPDRLNSDNEPINQNVVPTCLSNYDATACGPVHFGDELWEFTDSVNGSPAEWGTSFDEDNNSAPDLGDTWSVPVIGRIKVLDSGGDFQDRWVAIFGGGFDPDDPTHPQRGNWLYMVDVETGEAIYKQPLDGAAPSTPAAVDQNRDGYIDTVYIGTTAGYLYKVDTSIPVAMTTVSADLLGGGTPVDVERIADSRWQPFKIFDTVDGSGRRQPIFFPPTVLNVAELGRFALAFGTGNRDDLWQIDGVENRFYVFVDENFTPADVLSGVLPKVATDYAIFDSEGALNSGSDFLLQPASGLSRGWVMTLDPDERMVSPAFSISGVTIFPTFKPQIITTTGSSGAVCARTGDSRVFVVFTNNGDPILPPEGGSNTRDRSMTVGEALVTPPFVEPGTGRNPIPTPTNPDKTAWENAIKDTLKDLFPSDCRFANYSVGVSFIRSDTGVVGPIPVPICIVEKNWKEIF